MSISLLKSETQHLPPIYLWCSNVSFERASWLMCSFGRQSKGIWKYPIGNCWFLIEAWSDVITSSFSNVSKCCDLIYHEIDKQVHTIKIPSETQNHEAKHFHTFLDFELHSPSFNGLWDAREALAGICLPANDILSIGLRVKRCWDVELSSVF